MVLDDKQRQIGKDNFADALRISRRQLLTAAVAVPSAAAIYWGYDKLKGDPVRVGIIGTGDQGRAHISSSNPDYVKFVAYSDIRPFNQKEARKLFSEKYGDEAKGIELYEDYNKLLDRSDLEMVIIALPLHLHKLATVAALEKGKHVLCEKLMAKTVMECKEMVRAAKKAGKLLAIGHQRHYSYMYANALSIIQQGILGDIRHIRAYWHRNQTNAGAPGADMGKFDGWKRAIPDEDQNIDFKKYGYESLDQLISWRLDARTGGGRGGLMVELGSHQLDACGIFLGKVHPKMVQGLGVKSFFKNERDVDDHIFLTYEYGEDANNAVVTYSSISTNAFDGYGEQVMGTKGTMIVQQEHDAYVFGEGVDSKNTRITWAEDRVGRPTTDSGSTVQWATGIDAADTLTSRGYREEQEHLAWIIRNPDAGQQPRCNGEVALADAVVALTSNLAMAKQKRIEFKKEWYDPNSDSVPENEV